MLLTLLIELERVDIAAGRVGRCWREAILEAVEVGLDGREERGCRREFVSAIDSSEKSTLPGLQISCASSSTGCESCKSFWSSSSTSTSGSTAVGRHSSKRLPEDERQRSDQSW